MDGLLIIDKPAGCTSHDVVAQIRRLLHIKRVGHGGTLDPDATGVLLVAVGQATRFFPYLPMQSKTYEGEIRLGFSTDTYDASGIPTSDEIRDYPSLAEVRASMKGMEGETLQIPPRYSAKKIQGTPMYRMARAHREFEPAPAQVTIHRFALREYEPPIIVFEAECSAGTYVRSLAHDLGRNLKCGAHLRVLRRTTVGPYALGEAVSLAAVEEAAACGEIERLLLPLETLLPGIPAVSPLPEACDRVANGSPLSPADVAGPPEGFAAAPAESLFRVVAPSGKLLALARLAREGDRLCPVLVLR